jgi:hypothetical protein
MSSAEGLSITGSEREGPAKCTLAGSSSSHLLASSENGVWILRCGPSRRFGGRIMALTHDTGPLVCPVKVLRACPEAQSHTFAVPSREDDTSIDPSKERERERTAPVCPT